MHLKSLTVRGFKSFATATTFRFEPGITAVVGPNGSGKSNVVDAIAWVLGQQGAKALRGGSMSDVIFAGTPNRPALGRAEVTLTIDNSDGALALAFTEVSITRLMFRSGESEYAINGTPCRLLDVQELMSDSGIGRELHVIVGQGQLDAVLQARPEDRRAFVEEAAGVLKHRKRKEKALRKLDAMAANLARVEDLTTELRRQLGPLGRQAEIARRAGSIQAVLRDARLRILADDLHQARATHAAELADEQAAVAERDDVERRLEAARSREADLDRDAAAAAPAFAAAQDTYYRLTGLRERSRGLVQLASERGRHLAEPPAGVTHAAGADPERLDAEAAQVRAERDYVDAALRADRERLDAAADARQRDETALRDAEVALTAALRAAADRREGLARLAGQVSAAESRVVAGEAELGRLAAALGAARARERSAEADLVAVQEDVGALDLGELGLDTAHERAASVVAELQAELDAQHAAERGWETTRGAAQARWEALSLALDRRDGAGALLSSGEPGILGSVAALLTVEPGAETAIAAALGAYAGAVAVASPAAAVHALELLKATEAGRAGLAIGGAPAPPDRGPAPVGRWAADLVASPAALRGAVAQALDGVVVVPDLTAAAGLPDPGLRAVTTDGDIFGNGWATGGSQGAPSLLEMQAAADEARAEAEFAARAAEEVRERIVELTAQHSRAAAEVDAALDALHSSDARMAAVAEQLALLTAAVRSAGAEADRLERQQQQAREAQAGATTDADELRGRLERAQPIAADDRAPDPTERDHRAATLVAARAHEVDARLAVRTGEERVRALATRADALTESARAERDAAARRHAAAQRRRRDAVRVASVLEVGNALVTAVDAAVGEAAAARDQAGEARALGEAELGRLRAEVRDLADRADQLRDRAHRDEVARAEQRLRVQAIEERALTEHGIVADALVAEYGPDCPVPPDVVQDGTHDTGDTGDTVLAPQPYDRTVQVKRAAAAERQLNQLGKVNPLALEEFTALEERHQFLAAQLDDLKTTRRDLLSIVAEVDGHIHEIFRAAYEDTAREFTEVFAILFPGGSGRLELTDPDDLMQTGIDVIARPAGKKVSRLSLLSGGERSLAAIALLVAIFRARPSPFYILDEVEAALDDRNLQRLLHCLEGLRERSQLIIITHQKRTMEIADALYGVSMRGDGVSTVISQRLREAITA